MKRRLFTTLGSFALAASLALGVVTPATAAPAPSVASTHIAAGAVVKSALAPLCVDVIKEGRTWYGSPYVTIKNKCKSKQRVKVIWRSAADGACKSLAPGKTHKDVGGAIAKFDGLKRC